MRVIASAVLLAIMQTLPPVPRKAADNAAGSRQHIENQSSPQKAPSPSSSSPINAEAANRNKAKGDSIRAEDAEQPIRITELPPVSVRPAKRDWADWGYWVFSGLLVIVGGFQVWLLLRTLRAIGRQADLMETQTTASAVASAAAMKSAEAAKENVEVFISKERARLRLELEPLKLETPGEFAIQEVRHKVVIHGSTPALIVDSGSFAYVSDSEQPSRDQGVLPPMLGYHDNVMLPTAAPITGTTFLHQKWEKLTETEITAIQNDKLFVHFCGFIKYKDAFDRERETRFTYLWHIYMRFADGESLGYWTKCGNEADNRET